MIHLLLWLLVVWGVTSILTRGRIVRPFRDLLSPGTLYGDFVRCDQCVGLWVGLTLSLFLGLGAPLPWRVPDWGHAILDGIASSAMCAGIGLLTDWLKAATLKHYGLKE